MSLSFGYTEVCCEQLAWYVAVPFWSALNTRSKSAHLPSGHGVDGAQAEARDGGDRGPRRPVRGDVQGHGQLPAGTLVVSESGPFRISKAPSLVSTHENSLTVSRFIGGLRRGHKCVVTLFDRCARLCETTLRAASARAGTAPPAPAMTSMTATATPGQRADGIGTPFNQQQD